jgi:hypothetical protein
MSATAVPPDFPAVAAAFPLAGLLVGAVGKTISSLYVLVSIENLAVTRWQIAAAAAAGLSSVVTAAWIPSAEAAKVQVTRALHLGTAMEHYSTVPRRWLACGLVSLALAFGACAV